MKLPDRFNKVRKLWPFALFVLVPAPAHSEDAVASGRLVHIDGVARIVTLSDGSTFVVNKRVKISTRSVGELVLVTHRQTSHGREALRIRLAPVAIHSLAAGPSSNVAAEFAAPR